MIWTGITDPDADLMPWQAVALIAIGIGAGMLIALTLLVF